MKPLLFLSLLIAGCCGTKEITTNTYESDSTVVTSKLYPVFIQSYKLILDPIIKIGVPMTYAPVQESFLSRDSTVRVDIDRENPDKPQAQFTFNGDSIDALGREVTHWKRRYEEKETKIGDSFFENIYDYALGFVLGVVLMAIVLFVKR